MQFSSNKTKKVKIRTRTTNLGSGLERMAFHAKIQKLSPREKIRDGGEVWEWRRVVSGEEGVRKRQSMQLEAKFNRLKVGVGHKEIRGKSASRMRCHGNCGCFISYSNHEYLPSLRMNFSLISLQRSKLVCLSVNSENFLQA